MAKGQNKPKPTDLASHYAIFWAKAGDVTGTDFESSCRPKLAAVQKQKAALVAKGKVVAGPYQLVAVPDGTETQPVTP